MEWYYADGVQRRGPISDEQLQSLVDRGMILPDTLVWHSGVSEWTPYKDLQADHPRPKANGNSSPVSPLPRKKCSQCGQVFSSEELISLGGNLICAVCKPAYFQRLKEGGLAAGPLNYAGVWKRFNAIFLDGLILGGIGMLLNVAGGLFSAQQDPEAALAIQLSISAFQIILGATYEIWFIGKYGATLGKKACGLKVINSDGSKLSYGRSTGRYFAKGLSGMLLMIGYLMAFFDDEKRTLHDRICETRVIKS